MSCAAKSGSVPSTSRSVETDKRSAIAWTATWCTASPRLRAISITRSRTVSSSSARGSVVMVTSASGMSARMARVSPSLMAVTRSSGSARLTPTPSSMNSTAPAGRARTRSTATMPGTRRAIAATRSLTPAGAASVKRVDGAPAKPPAGNADEDRDHQRRRGVGPGIAERDAGQSDQDGDRRPHVGAEMQRVGFERLTRCFFGDTAERAGAEEIHNDRRDDDGESRCRRLDRINALADQPLRRLVQHDGGEQKQQCGLGERGDAFHLAVAVLVLGVGRLAGDAHRDIGQHRCRQIEQRMAGLRQDGQRASE